MTNNNIKNMKTSAYTKALQFLGFLAKKGEEAVPYIQKGMDKGIEKLEGGLKAAQTKIEEKAKEVKKEHEVKSEASTPTDSEYCTIDDFGKIKFKVGEIKEAHLVEGADKLYRFLVDVGEESGPRTILSGIREYFPNKDVFIGKKVCVVANLAPRKMRGFESNGMLLFAGGDSGKLFSVSPDSDTPVGTTIR